MSNQTDKSKEAEAKAAAEAEAKAAAEESGPKQYVVALAHCSWGKKGDVVELEGDLTPRQSAMLKPYKAPEVKKLATAKK